MKRTIQAPAVLSPSSSLLSSGPASPAPSFTIYCGRDKSLTHRAIMFASLSQGRSQIHYPLLGADCLSTISCFEALGVKIDVRETTHEDSTIHVISGGPSQFKQPTRELDCGNSGTTARLILGILAAQKGLTFHLIGDESLSKRPMNRVVNPLRKMGAVIDGADAGNFLPLTVAGQNLKALSHEVDKASAQVKSCILLAGMFAEGETRVRLPKGSRDHTEKVLQTMGAAIHSQESGEFEEITLRGPFASKAVDLSIPVDPSSAAFFAVLGLLLTAGGIRMPDVLDNPTRTGFMKVLARMSHGLTFTRTSGTQEFVEPVGLLAVTGGLQLNGTTIEASEVPTLVDEIPILAVAAAFAKGPSLFLGLSELRVKESDRLVLTGALLKAVGSEYEIRGDDLWIAGGLKEVKAFEFDPAGDHRLAMAASIFARRSKKPCCILDSECVRVSFPRFYEALEAVNSF